MLAMLSWRREGETGVEADVVDLWVGTAGAPFALEALLAGAELRVRGSTFSMSSQGGIVSSTESLFLVAAGSSLEVHPFSLLGQRPAWDRLRHLLAVAPEPLWNEAAEAAERLRRKVPLAQRIAISFLFPDVLDWGATDAREAFGGALPVTQAGCLATCVRDGALATQLVAAGRDPNELFERMGGGTAPEVAGVAFSLVEGCGPVAVPALSHLLDQARTGGPLTSAADRKACAEALALLPDAMAFEALAARLDIKEAVAALGACTRREPRIGLPVLAARVARDSKGPAAGLLSALLGAAGPEVEELVPSLSDAARRAVEAMQGRAGLGLREATAAELPSLLTSPPWTGRAKARKDAGPSPFIVQPHSVEEGVLWEPGEEERWLQATARESGMFSSALDRIAFEIWQTLPFGDRQYGTDPRGWLARQSPRRAIEALTAAVPVQPEAGIDLCLPFCSPRLAPIVAREHLRRPRVRAAARRWLARHTSCALAVLIPAAVGPAGKEREEAEAALRWLAESGHRESVEAAADGYGAEARAAVEALLAADPLLRLPAKIPKRPAFWMPATFARPRLRAAEAVLPLSAVDVLGTMLAVSPLGDPYAGLAQVREACDPASLGRFAWDLFNAWLTAGAPSKEAWAFHALGVLGDDDVARRLGALVRDTWPSAAEHTRAITGLDVLEAMGGEAALFQLHQISQKGTTRGIRDRAAGKLAGVAAQRGLTPDDLEDLLLPVFDLDANGSRELSFGARSFRVGFDELLRPFVQDAAGKRLKDLPKPGKADDPQLAEAALLAWKELKKEVKAVAGDRLRRYEQAMCTRGRWEPELFLRTQVQHPLAGHLARRLVWGIWDAQDRLAGTFRVCEDRTLADAADQPFELPEGTRVGVVHPLDLDEPLRTAWGEIFADYEIVQPFAQLGRETFPCAADEADRTELVRYAGLRLPTGKLLGLEARGWTRGEPQDGPVSFWSRRSAAGTGLVLVVEYEPGIVNGAPLTHPEQTLRRAALLRHPSHEPAGVTLGQLDPVAFSEIVRDLETLR
jgi:hypothetical protein